MPLVFDYFLGQLRVVRMLTRWLALLFMGPSPRLQVSKPRLVVTAATLQDDTGIIVPTENIVPAPRM